MKKIVKLDDVSWHIHEIDSALPEKTREERAGAHMGLLLRWCYVKGFELTEAEDTGKLLDASERQLISAVKAGRLPGMAFLSQVSDSKFATDLVSPTIRPFLMAYYDSKDNQFLTDFGATFDKQVYAADESEFDFKAFARMIDLRKAEFDRWPAGQSKFGALPAGKPPSFWDRFSFWKS